MAVIGGIFLNNAKAIEVLEVLTASDFYTNDNQKIFRAIELCYDAELPIDVLTVSNKLNEIKELENIGGLRYLAETAENTPSAANVMAYAEIVEDLSKSRQMDAQARQIHDALHSDDGTSKEKINKALSVAANIGDFEDGEKEREFNEIQKSLLKMVEERIASGGGLTGESMAFKALDDRFNGFNPTDLIILAGRPSMGKTTLGINLTNSVAKNKHAVIFSMEMSAEQITEKMWASNGECPLSCIKTGVFVDKKLNEDYYTQFHNGVAKTKRLNYTIDDRGGLTPQQVRAKCLRLKKKHGGLGLVMVDYLQLMNVNKSTGQTDKVTQISGALKALAKELKCPVLVLSQLNRGLESRPNKRPMMSDLRDSGAIEQDADIIMFCYRDDYYQEREGDTNFQPNNITEVITAKFRGGEVGTDYLSSQLKFSRFVDVRDDYTPQAPVKKKKAEAKVKF